MLWVAFRCGFGLQVSGQEHVPKRGPFIVASNHLSFLDPPLLGVACPRPLVFMARADLFHHPLLGAYLRAIHVLPLQRGESDAGAIRQAIALLKTGHPIAMFPEGGRQRDGKLGVAKRGVGLLATMAAAPIVPAFVKGTFEALPPRARRLSRSKIRVAFGPPIPYSISSVRPPTEQESSRVGQGRVVDGTARQRYDHLAELLTSRWRQLEAQMPV